VELEVDPETGMKNYIANGTCHSCHLPTYLELVYLRLFPSERGHWDTSKALVRRTLEQCIHLGRLHRANGRKEDEYEAYRLLGQAVRHLHDSIILLGMNGCNVQLHTLEDFSAHSNFCELTLVSMGYTDVFVHVGDSVRIRVPYGQNANQMVAPLITGQYLRRYRRRC
jgi:hypothetical protein